VGSQPLGTDFFVQTSVANQINLVNLAGLNLSFWDGPALPRNNGVLEGGIGTWILNNNENWATIDGLINAPYQNGSFTVFQGAAGTVTVDNSQGQLTAAGMQFAVDGYTLAGGPLTLAASQSTIRVGDGTLAGAGYVATITSVLQGGSQLVKTDLGTLVLTATNSYSGGTAINGGTLQVASNANLGALAGGLSFDGGTLENTAAFTSNRAVTLDAAGGTFEATADLTLTGLVSGTGALTKDGAGTLVLTATNNYTGNTTIAAGTLQLGAGGTTGSILGDVVNNGTLGFNRSNSYTFGGDISGTGEVNQIGTGTTILTGTNNYITVGRPTLSRAHCSSTATSPAPPA
jgi:fibronectin-binding autotransporter adhesin